MGAGWYADALIPLFDESNGRRQSSSAQYKCVPFSTSSSRPVIPFWVDIFTPSTAAAGKYTGTIAMKVCSALQLPAPSTCAREVLNCSFNLCFTCACWYAAAIQVLIFLLCAHPHFLQKQTNAGDQVISITLNVWNFALPLYPTQRSLMGLWGNSRYIPSFGTDEYKAHLVSILRYACTRACHTSTPFTCTRHWHHLIRRNYFLIFLLLVTAWCLTSVCPRNG